MADTVKPGRYRHYKGQYYDVVGVGKYTETEEDVVVYCPLYTSDVAYWVRPLNMFFDSVTIDGVSVPRFSKMDSDE